MSHHPIWVLLITFLLNVLQNCQNVVPLTSPSWCQKAGTPQFPSVDKSSTSTNDFDYTSNYLTPELESAPLYVKKGTNLNPFTFSTYSNLSAQSTTQCLNSQGLLFVRLINEFLFLMSSQGNYYVCKYINGTNSSRIELAITNNVVTGTLVEYYPYLVASNSIFVLASSITMSRVLVYSWTSGATIISPNAARGPTSIQIQVRSSQVVGGDMYLYDLTNQQFLIYNANGLGWAPDTTYITKSIIGTNTVASYPLRLSRLILTLTDSTKRSGSIYTLYQRAPTLQVATTTGSTFDIQYFTDNQNNFVRIESEGFTWITMKTVNFAFMKTTLTTATMGITTRYQTLANILHVGLSQNKAVVIYDNGMMDVLKHEASGTVKAIFTYRQITGNPVLSLTQSKQYTINLTCFCGRIKKLVCYSHTLNCVIVNKAQKTCSKFTYLTTTW